MLRSGSTVRVQLTKEATRALIVSVFWLDFLNPFVLVDASFFYGDVNLRIKKIPCQVLSDIQRSSKYLTVMPYTHETARFKNTTFPNVNTLTFINVHSVEIDFLKCKLYIYISNLVYFSVEKEQLAD